MVRKRIPLVKRPDSTYASGLQGKESPEVWRALPAETDVSERDGAGPIPTLPQPAAVERRDPSASTQVDVRVTALDRQEAALLACGIDPRHVIRASLRKAVKAWHLSPAFLPASGERRAKEPSWTARTSLAVPAAVFDRLQATHDPLGVCSRWSLVRGQLEPAVWDEIDRLLASLQNDDAA